MFKTANKLQESSKLDSLQGHCGVFLRQSSPEDVFEASGENGSGLLAESNVSEREIRDGLKTFFQSVNMGEMEGSMRVGRLVESLQTELGLTESRTENILLLLGEDPDKQIDLDTFITSAMSWWSELSVGNIEEDKCQESNSKELDISRSSSSPLESGCSSQELIHCLSLERERYSQVLGDMAEMEDRLQCGILAEERYRKEVERMSVK